MKNLIFCIATGWFFHMPAAYAQDAGKAANSEAESFMAKLKVEAPKLYEFHMKISDVFDEIMKVEEALSTGKISQDNARAALIPLFKEKIALENDPDFRAEQQFYVLLQELKTRGNPQAASKSNLRRGDGSSRDSRAGPKSRPKAGPEDAQKAP